MLSGSELVIVIVIVALLFGVGRLPMMGRNLGQGIREFQKGLREAAEDSDHDTQDSPRNQRTNAGQPDATPTSGGPDAKPRR